ncbi:Glycosyl transferases group 1 [Plasmodiophora brassicae]
MMPVRVRVVVAVVLLAAWAVGAAAPPTVIWMAPFWSGGGYCSEAIDFVLAMQDAGLDVAIRHHGDSVDRGFVAGLDASTRSRLKAMENRFYSLTSTSSAIVVCHSEPGAWAPALYHTSECPPRSGAAVTIGRTMFETDRLPDGWPPRLDRMDRIWVPTDHMKGIMAPLVSKTIVEVVPEPVDTDWFRPDGPRMTRPGPCASASSVFLSIFKWEPRKAWDILVEAFAKEFAGDGDSVCLMILTHGYHSTTNDYAGEIGRVLREKHGLSPPETLVVLPEGLPDEQMPSLYRAADVFVLPSRGEGWGRPHVEAMACGIPIIATNWSGPTAFMTEANGYPLRYDGMDTIDGGAFQGHRWARPSVHHLRTLMRLVHDDVHGRKAKGRQARLDVVQYYAKDVLGSLLRQRISQYAGSTDRPEL